MGETIRTPSTPSVSLPTEIIHARTEIGRHCPSLPLKIGTRASPLALVQTRAFLARLTKFCPVLHGLEVFQEFAIRTTGDRSQASGVRLADVGGKGLFSKELHEAMIDFRVDMAVHSLKDLETELPPGIVLACVLPREDNRDVLILGPACDTSDAAGLPYPELPIGSTVGSSSVRRQAQLLHARPDLKVEVIRGNVHGRLDKVRRGDYAASLLAMAGLRRLGLEHEADVAIECETMLPAACQGIVGITCREGDTELRRLLAALSCPEAHLQAQAERALLGALDGSCHTPIGAHAVRISDDRLRITGLVAKADGSFLLRRSVECDCVDAAAAGAALGDALRADSPCDLFA